MKRCAKPRLAKPRRVRDERGVALVEVMVAMVLLTTVLLSLAAATGHAARQMAFSRRDMDVWSALQSQAESLMAVGYSNVTSGSATVRGYPVTWTVSGTDPKQVMVQVTYPLFQGGSATQSFPIYLPQLDSP